MRLCAGHSSAGPSEFLSAHRFLQGAHLWRATDSVYSPPQAYLKEGLFPGPENRAIAVSAFLKS
jgi:hypothetical protein